MLKLCDPASWLPLTDEFSSHNLHSHFSCLYIEGHTSLVLLPNGGRHRRRRGGQQRHRRRRHESRARVRDVVGDAVLLVPHDARHLRFDL